MMYSWGDGNDTGKSRSGSSWLTVGTDNLRGGKGGNIFIAGFSDLDIPTVHNLQSIDANLAEWNAGAFYPSASSRPKREEFSSCSDGLLQFCCRCCQLEPNAGIMRVNPNCAKKASLKRITTISTCHCNT